MTVLMVVGMGILAPAIGHAASAGCDAVNAGQLNYSTGTGGSTNRTIGPLAFEQGEMLDLTLNLAGGFVSNVGLSYGATTTSQLAPPNGHTLSLTIASSGNFTAQSSMGEYGGGASASVAVTCTGVAVTTVTSLASSTNPSQPGQSVTFTATISESVVASDPSGTVTFFDGGTIIGTGTVSNHVATFTTAALALGQHPITAYYGGDANFAASLSAGLEQTVQVSTATVALSINNNPATFGDAVTFTATVDRGSPPPTIASPGPNSEAPAIGTVTFSIDGTPQAPVALSGQTAQFTISTLTIGDHIISATYNGDATTGAATSADQTLTVMAPEPLLTLMSSLNPSNLGENVTFTVTVATIQGLPTPSGEAVVQIDGINHQITLSGGTATFVTNALTAGDHPVASFYLGDANYSNIEGPFIVQTVNGAPDTSTSTSLDSSKNPSDVGESVVFTAVVMTDSGTPTGDVVFSIDGVDQPAVPLVGGAAALTISTLTAGDHVLFARYSGASGFDASTSVALTQRVNSSMDSQNLRQLQVTTTKLVAQTSGQAISGAIDSAIDEGFSDDVPLISATDGSVRVNFAADAPMDTQTADPLTGIAFDRRAPREEAAGQTGQKAIDLALGRSSNTYALTGPAITPTQRNWRVWADVRNTNWRTSADRSDIVGSQVNMLAGVTYRITPRLLAGVFGGYESFSYASQPLNGRLTGQGWTAGAYLGWRPAAGIRFDAGVARSIIDYAGVSGAANGSFDGQRWLFQSGVTATRTVGGFVVEPSARIYALWERENAYTDSLGTVQGARTFMTGRASGGIKITYPFEMGADLRFAPFAGVYGDYYFSQDDASAALTVEDALRNGWSARFVGGLSVQASNGVQISLTGELGGIGAGGAPHGAVRGRFSMGF